MRRLPLTRPAQTDLDEIVEHVAADSPRVAKRLLQKLLEQCRHVCETPLGHAACEDLRPGLRRAVCRPCLVSFVLDKTGVRIERIVHGARDLPSLFKE